MTQKKDHFRLETCEEVAEFDSLLQAYESAHAGQAVPHISLVKIYDICQHSEQGGRIFVSFLDIRLSFSYLHLAVTKMFGTWNQKFSPGKLAGGKVIDSPQKFFGKMEIHQSATEFVHRYRALWDKVMGLLVLLHCPDEYDNYCGAKSRRKYFKRLAKVTPQIGEELGSSWAILLEAFDNRFRTPEVHGTGSLRKWSFQMIGLNENPQVELADYWNELNHVVADLQGQLEAWHDEKHQQHRG